MASEFIKVERSCRYGHGPLENLGGDWAIESVAPVAEDRRQFAQTGRRMIATLLQCKKCGYLELIDEGH